MPSAADKKIQMLPDLHATLPVDADPPVSPRC